MNKIDKNMEESKGIFAQARQAAKVGKLDRAIDLYLQGLRLEPDAVHEGHVALRELALSRYAQGGSKASAEEVSQRSKGQTPLEQMLNAEYLLAKDPEHMPYAEAMLKAAVAGGYRATVNWMADLIFLANNGAKRPSLHVYLLLKDSYKATGFLERAVAACRRALRLKPDDRELAKELRVLAAKLTASRRKTDRKSEEVEDNHIAALAGNLGMDNSEQLETEAEQDFAKANAFFEKGKKAAEMGNFEYAIDMYIEGLRFAPEALQDGHLPLCELGLQRQSKNGKKPSMMERMKRMHGKTSLEQMLNAEYLFVKDPSHLPYAEAMLKAAVAGGYKKTANWIANLIFQTNNAASKQSVRTYILLKDSYSAMGEYDKAVAACQRALRLKPNDKDLADDYKNLSAELTMASGKYDVDGDFRQSIKDRETQAKLYAQDRVVKTQDYRVRAAEDARKAFARNPNLPKNIFHLADVLADLGSDEGENEAIKLLENAYKSQKDFSYMQRAGLVRIRKAKRKLKQAKAAIDANPDDAKAKAKVEELSNQLNKTELEHYRLCMENYPTSLQAKYDLGVRLVRNKRYDEAIPLLQEAQKDPRRHISAMNQIGYSFFMKGWYADAIDVLKRAIDAYEIKDDAIAKELRYNLARAHEQQGDKDKALEIYRKIAQYDFSYKDVSERVSKLRGRPGKS
jgi:tetratricopeptide (TPR) repeat protein